MKRTHPMSLARAAALSTAVLAFGACANLSLIQDNVCGNGVVEPDNGEDCDDPHDASCGKPGTVEACRYTCDGKTGAGCPPAGGYGCGVDGICRAPQTTPGFEPLLTQGAATTVDLIAGDTNGDRCAELVYTTVHGAVDTALASNSPGFCAASEQVLASHPLPPSVAPYAAPFLVAPPAGAGLELVVPGVGLLVGSAAHG